MAKFDVRHSYKYTTTTIVEAEEASITDGVLQFFTRLPNKETTQGTLVSTRIHAFKKWASYKLLP